MALDLGRQHITWILSVAVFIRFCCAGMDMQLWPDSHAYLQTAKAITQMDWSNMVIERTPGYPLLLIITGAINGAPHFYGTYLAQMLLGILTALLTGSLVSNLTGNPMAGRWAGMGTALLPNLLYYEHQLLSETLYTTALTILAWMTCRYARALTQAGEGHRYLLSLALISGLLVWIKPIALLSISLLAGLLWQQRLQKSVAIYTTITGLFITGWLVVQWQAHGIVGFTPASGVNQLYKVVDHVHWDTPIESGYKAKLKSRVDIYPPGQTYNAVNDTHVETLLALETQHQKQPQPNLQAQKNKAYLAHNTSALQLVKEITWHEPWVLVVTSLQHLWRVLTQPGPWDMGGILWSVQGLMTLLGNLLLVAQIRHNTNHPTGPLTLLVLLGIPLVHLVAYSVTTWCEARYRVPLEPFFIVYIVCFVQAWWHQRQKISIKTVPL